MSIFWVGGGYVCDVRLASPNYTDGYALLTFGVLTALNSADDVGTGFAQALQDSGIIALLDGGTAVENVHCYDETEEATIVLNEPGGRTGEESIYPNCAVLVEKRTAVRGRRAIGRSFWPGLLQLTDVNEDGSIDGALLTDLQDAMSLFATELGNQTMAMAITQHETAKQKSEPLDPWPVVTGYVVDPVISTQRRRLRR